jgi:trans-aconitate methyltransferase
MGTGSHFSGVKRPGLGVDHSLPCRAEVKEWVIVIPLLPLGDFVACSRINITFILLPYLLRSIFPSEAGGKIMYSFLTLFIIIRV